jgi:asparagine synthase (glutamine-hydrolysing)
MATAILNLVKLRKLSIGFRMRGLATGASYTSIRCWGYLECMPGLPLSGHACRAYLRLKNVPQYPGKFQQGVEDSIGGPNAWIDAYGLLGLAKLRFYSESMRAVMHNEHPWRDLDIPLERAKRWDPLNRGVWVAARVTLAGHLLQAKGDRVSMNSSVEVRYPFLDEDVFEFTSRLHPRWKLRGLRDKHILRLLAERWLPPSVYRRPKAIFRAPLDSFHMDPEPVFVGQLLSEESLRKTGYFDTRAVHHWRKMFRGMSPGSLPRLSVEMGLTAVVATQLWHHIFISGDLAELPAQAPAARLHELPA